MSIYNKIKKLNFFNTLNDTQLDILKGISSINNYNDNYVLTYENSTTPYLYFLISGLVKSYKIDKHNNEIFLYYITSENIISEITSISSDTLTTYSNILFCEDSEVLQIDFKLFKANFLDNNILIREFLNEIILRGKKLEDLINREFIHDAVTKVSMMIDVDLDTFNKLKRHDIALILNIQPATLSRVLNRLKKDLIINIDRGVILTLNQQKLKAIYQDKK